jgi:hypothetical protein
VKIFKILGLKNRATGGSIGENTVRKYSPTLIQKSQAKIFNFNPAITNTKFQTKVHHF